MVAYSFRPRFVDLIASGAKRQTIRADRKRHALAGEELQLYTGMRTRSCRLIGRAPCVHVGPVQIDLRAAIVETPEHRYSSETGLDVFARRDGFQDWYDMRRFWLAEHPGTPIFSGVLIVWGDLLPPEAA